MNYSDTQRVERLLRSLGYEQAANEEETDLFILTTCSVRQKSEDKVVGRVKELNKMRQKDTHKSHVRIGLTGCMLHYGQATLYRRMPGLDFVFHIDDLLELPKKLQQSYPEGDELQDYLHIAPQANDPYKVSIGIPIMTGCDNYCTYCIVPYSRGRERSRAEEEILQEVENALKEGYKEIVLLGQNVNNYKKDPDAFAHLVQRVDAFSKDYYFRLRYTSPHPQAFSDIMIQNHARLSSLCEHTHMPAQAGDDTILRRMNRQYTQQEFLQLMDKFRTARPDMAITTDLIVGFPGETKEQFEKSLDLYKKAQFDFTYPAMYSPRPGTLAARVLHDDVEKTEKSRRFHEINELQKSIAKEKRARDIGQTYEILVTGYDEASGNARGRTRGWIEVFYKGSKEDIGQFVNVHITDTGVFDLYGEKV